MDIMERNRQIYADRETGMTMRQLAEKYHLSLARIEQIVHAQDPSFYGHFRVIGKKTVIYRGLREWMNANHMSITGLTVRIGYAPHARTYSRMQRCLNGSASLRIEECRGIMILTGMKFEELFGVG